MVCQPQSSGHFEFISPSLRGCFKRSRVICQEICPKVFLTLFSGVEGLGAWPLPPRSKRIFCVSIYGDRGNVTCTTSDCHLCYTLDTRQCTTRISHLCTTITCINASLGFVSVAHNELLLFESFFSLLPRLDWLFPRQSEWGSLILGFCLFHTSPVAEELIQ